MTVPLAPTATLGERYVLDERIAVGGMGEVWRATDRVLDRTVAVKVLKPEYAADPTFLERFRAEARHTAALSHPGIANVYDYGEIGDRAYLVMEHVAGEPLSAVLGRDGSLAPDRVLDVVGQAGLALQAAHEAGVVHRDVKPANLLIRPDGVVKVTDFGIARAVDAAPVTQTGFVVGTAAYLSPEQAAGKPVTAASDIYALGVVTYECLTGQRPFTGDSAVTVALAHVNDEPPSLPKTVPPLVADFVGQALSKDPSRRQPSAGEFGRTALALATTLRAAPAAAGSSPAPTRVMPTADAPAAAPDPGFDDAQRRRVRNTFIAIGAAVVIVGFLLLHSCDATSNPTRAGTASTKPTASATPHVTVRSADYVGGLATAATAALRTLGFTVHEQFVRAPGPAGSVVAVNPTGSLPRGSVVTLSVASAPPAPPHDKHHGKGDGGDGGN